MTNERMRDKPDAASLAAMRDLLKRCRGNPHYFESLRDQTAQTGTNLVMSGHLDQALLLILGIETLGHCLRELEASHEHP